MRTGRRILLVVSLIVIAVVAFAALVAFTPLGWRMGLPFARRTLLENYGLALGVDGVGGMPVKSLTLTGVTLDDHESGRMASISELTCRYDVRSLLRGEPVIHELSAEGLDLTFAVGPDSALVGWSRFAAADTVAREEVGDPVAWTLGRARLDRTRVRYEDPATGLLVDAVIDSLVGSGTQDTLDLRLAAAGTVSHPALLRPARILAGAAGRMVPGAVELENLTLSGRAVASVDSSEAPVVGDGDAFDLVLRGIVPMSPDGSIRLDLKGSVVAEDLLPLLAAADAASRFSGRLNITASLMGSWMAPDWEAAVDAPTLGIERTTVRELAIEASGTASAVELGRLEAGAFGGRVRMAGAADLSGAAPRVSARGTLTDIDLGALSGRSMEGRADGTVSAALDVGDLATLTADATLRGSGLRIARADTTPVELGQARLRVESRRGRFHAEAEALEAAIVADGRLAASGPESVTAELTVADLAATLAGLVPADVTGSLVATLAAERPMEHLAFTAEARAESLGFGPVLIGSAFVTAGGEPDDMNGRFSAFDGDVSGAWEAAGSGVMVDATLDSLAISGGFEVSPGRIVTVEGATTGRVAFSSTTGGAYDVTAELAELFIESAGQSVWLTSPVVVEASPDSVRVRDLSLGGTLGAMRVDGLIAPSGDTRVSAVLESLKLDSVMAVATAGAPAPDVRGVVSGRGDLTMSGSRLSLDASMQADDLTFNGIRVGDIAVDVESDDDDLIFGLESVSEAGGRITAMGSLPYASDSTSVFSIRTDREFAATVLCSSYVFEGGPAFMPRIRGRKQFRLNGSALVAGRADSLGSMNGAGRFDQIGAAWGFVAFSLADTFDFTIADGAVELDRLSMEVMRQRALGPELGGRVEVSGRIEGDRRLNIAATTAALDVAHVSRALTPGATPPVTGMLTAEASVTGTLLAPRVAFSWNLAEPAIGGLSFDALRGSGVADQYVLELTNAELVLGSNVMTAAGTVPLQRAQGPALYPGMYAGLSEMDITVRADRFRLNRTRGLPKGMKRLAGVIDADIHVRGAPEAPDVEGVLTVSDGRVEFDELKQAVRDVTVRVTGSGGTATLERASARIGSGTVSASGSLTTSSSGGQFRLESTLDSVELTAEEKVDARVSGTLTWSGTPAASLLKGRISVDEADVPYRARLADVLARRPKAIVLQRASGPRASVSLDVAVEIVDPVRVRSNLAEMDLGGGVRIVGTLAEPSISGGVVADGGSVWYLGQEFLLDAFSIFYADPRRRVPHVEFSGTATVESNAGEEYTVTVRYSGFVGETVPELTSTPALSEPDIAALITFGDTLGGLTDGRSSDSSSESFDSLARSAFMNGLFGVAESTAKRWLDLETFEFSGESLDEGVLSDAQVTMGKRFGRRLTIDYTTDLGGFSGQTVKLSWKLIDAVSIETQANQEGNHGIGLKFLFRLD